LFNRFVGRLQWPQSRSNLLANASIFGASVAGIWVTVPDIYVKIVGSSIALGTTFFAARHISKFSVPQAFAVAYFKSFVEPVGKALKSGGGDIVYTDKTSSVPTKIVFDPEKVNAVLNIVIPKDLSPGVFGTPESKDGLVETQETLKKKKEGTIHLLTRKRGYTVYFDLKNGQNIQELDIFDMPNTLNPLSEILHGEETDQASQKQALERRIAVDKLALKEFSEQLNSSLTKVKAEIQNVVRIS